VIDVRTTRRDGRRLRRAIAIYAAVMLAGLSLPPSAGSLVLDSGDGRGNTSPPPDLPEWSNVGRRMGGPSLVYLGRRWILTAAHVGAGVVEFGGEYYDPVAGTPTPLHNEDGSEADLLLFRLARDPGLPALRLADRPPRIGEEVILVGMGSSRGQWVTVDTPLAGLADGFLWVEDTTKRWGTNLVSGPVEPVQHGDSFTMAIPIIFDRIDDVLGTREEASAALGDSGGALFAYADPLRPELGRVLSGVLFSVTSHSEQPPRSTLYGAVTFAAAVATYRDQLIALVNPACSNGLDDDGDGLIDAPADPDCHSADDEGEAAAPPRHGRGRWLIAGLLAVLGWRIVALWRARH